MFSFDSCVLPGMDLPLDKPQALTTFAGKYRLDFGEDR
jgi:hypothetical protein